MNQENLASIRCLAKNGSVNYTNHATDQIFTRKIDYEDIQKILVSNSNQIIEYQNPSQTPGKEHSDGRYLIYDPCSADLIVVLVFVAIPIPELRIITVEPVDETVWIRKNGAIPALARKGAAP